MLFEVLFMIITSSFMISIITGVVQDMNPGHCSVTAI